LRLNTVFLTHQMSHMTSWYNSGDPSLNSL
jgi:hypothetical protein